MRFLHIIIIILATIFINNEPIPQHQLDYQKRGNRYEGIKAIGVGAPDLELISFTGYREEIPPNTNVALRIKFYMPADNKIYITAQELRLQRFYFMKPIRNEWRSGWQVFWAWPTRDVINPLGIKFEDIGVVGRLHHDRLGSGNVAPLIIFHSKPMSEINQYDLYLRPQKTLSSVEYSVYRTGRNRPILSDIIQDNLYGNEPFPIHLNFRGRQKGEYKLILKCKIRGQRGGPSRTYTFYHNPIVN